MASSTQVQDMPAENIPSQTHPQHDSKVVDYGYLDSIKFYLGWKSPEYYEKRILSYNSFYPDETETKSSEVIDTDVGNNTFIHEFCVHNKLPVEPGKEPVDIVLVHGYGAALGFFYKNFDGLSDIPGSTLHAIDLNGFGLSGRPKFPNLKGDTVEDVIESEDFYIDSFEEWRRKRGLKKIVLIAHSLGGYLSSCYYLKYGEGVVTKLIMISPVGVEDSEFSLLRKESGNRDLTEDAKIANDKGVDIAQEMFDHRREYNSVVGDSDNLSIVSVEDNDNDIPKSVRLEQARTLKISNKWVTKLWEDNYSPFQMLRCVAPISTKFISRWTLNRFGKINDETELKDIMEYTSRIFLDKGSGEFGLTRLLAPGALAKMPLIKRIPEEIKIPSLWMYGDNCS
ncbi:unnamed protein product [Ambrosiozyma monospora]|uniref:Unnamed protein product n=1 Tax=Ambrosiozyma monospora TaxID=43982 RepID=A0A9W6Z5Q5_AMBMO|nr:unnamed protein product [Ambrosiozyma monospora]